ncbi:hypothetical protein MD484_g8354, partial [Candolleomyces efflorescens]
MTAELPSANSPWLRALAHNPDMVQDLENSLNPEDFGDVLRSMLNDEDVLQFIITARAAQIVARESGLQFEVVQQRLWRPSFGELTRSPQDIRLLNLVLAKAKEVSEAGWPFILFTSENPDPYYCLYGGCNDPAINPSAPQRAEASNPRPRSSIA